MTAPTYDPNRACPQCSGPMKALKPIKDHATGTWTVFYNCMPCPKSPPGMDGYMMQEPFDEEPTCPPTC